MRPGSGRPPPGRWSSERPGAPPPRTCNGAARGEDPGGAFALTSRLLCGLYPAPLGEKPLTDCLYVTLRTGAGESESGGPSHRTVLLSL